MILLSDKHVSVRNYLKISILPSKNLKGKLNLGKVTQNVFSAPF